MVTQLFYDTKAFGKWLDEAKEKGLRIPVLPGIMPIQTFQGFSRITHMCRTFIPDEVIQRLEPIKVGSFTIIAQVHDGNMSTDAAV